MKKKSVYQSLVISNFVVLLVAIVVAAVGFKGYTRFSAAQAEDYNTVILRQIREAFDEKMNSINKLMLDVSFDTDVSSLRTTEKEPTDLERYRTVQVMNSLGSYAAVYNFIDSIALYYVASDRVITNASAYASTEIFLENADCAYWTAEQWRGLFAGTGRQYRMGDGIFTVISPLSYDAGIFMVLNVDASFIADLTRNIRSLEQSLVAVSDNGSGALLFSFGNSALTEYAGRTETFKLGGEHYSAYALPSEVNDWTYSFILPENAFTAKATDLLTLSLVALLLLGGAVACLLLARRSFRPIRQIAASIAGRMGEELGAGDKDELQLIGEASHRAIDEYQNIKAVMNKYSLILRAKLLDQILKGVLDADKLTDEDRKVSGISFPYSGFYLALMSIQPEEEKNTSLNRSMGPLIMEYVESLYQEETAGKAYCVELNLGRVCVIANVPHYREGMAEQLVRAVAEYGYRSFGVTVTAAVGSCGEGAAQLAGQYVQCVRALERQLIRYPGVTVFTDQMEPESSVYYYPLEMETRLIDSVKAGNLKNVNEILDTVILENFVNASLTLEVSRCLFFNLMGTAIKVISTLGYSTDEIFEGDDCYRQITSCGNIADMEATLRQMFYAICIYINGRKRKGGQMIDQIVEHIRQNSADPNLSLLTVASSFGINPNYLSSYFKEQKGENFLAFLNSVRLEKACGLLKDTSLGLEDVALKVGYSGSAVLIRNFKRYLGMTPGQYREKMRHDVNGELR